MIKKAMNWRQIVTGLIRHSRDSLIMKSRIFRTIFLSLFILAGIPSGVDAQDKRLIKKSQNASPMRANKGDLKKSYTSRDPNFQAAPFHSTFYFRAYDEI